MLIPKPKDKTLFCCWLRNRLVEQNRVETSTREETYKIDEVSSIGEVWIFIASSIGRTPFFLLLRILVSVALVGDVEFDPVAERERFAIFHMKVFGSNRFMSVLGF
jgi:hypothetical protein